MKLGYLVPEFPAQTHIFFWREIECLRREGVEPALFSTRPPPRRLVAHAWSDEAARATVYLVPASVAGWAKALGAMLGAPRSGVARALGLFRRADVGGLRGRMRLFASMICGARLARICKRRGIGHVHAHSAASSAEIAMFASAIGSISYSLTLHGPLDDYGPNQRQKFEQAAMRIVITDRLKGEVVDALGLAPSSLTVAPMGVDLERVARRRPYAPWRSGPVTLFSCGRLNPVKGHQTLIDAVALLKAAGVDVRLSIAGEDEQGGTGFRRRLEEQIERLGLGAEVELLGAVDETVILAGLEAADIFVLASRHEPLGVAIMEAMAMGTPVIATAAGGVRELVTTPDEGLLVPPEDAPAIVRAVDMILRDPDLARRMSAGGRARVEAQFGSERSARLLVPFAA